jgi:hypothetical protein
VPPSIPVAEYYPNGHEERPSIPAVNLTLFFLI